MNKWNFCLVILIHPSLSFYISLQIYLRITPILLHWYWMKLIVSVNFHCKDYFSFKPSGRLLNEEYIWMADLLVNLCLSTKRNLDNVMFRIQVNGYWKKNRLKGWFLVVVFVLVEMKVKKINRLMWQPLDCKKQDQSHGQSPICY